MTKTYSFLTALMSVVHVVQALPTSTLAKDSSWPGWAGIKYWFVFGDSYTTTSFNINGVQPSPSNPLGNPAYHGHTSSDGPNWVDYLTTEYNSSLIQTYNFAYGGATLDAALIEQYLPTVLSVKQQVQDEFLPFYTGTVKQRAFWKGDNTLFSIFVGINDVGNSYRAKNASLFPLVFQEYAGLLEQLHTAGARTLLLLTVPPVQRSPVTQSHGASAVALEAAAIADWNARLLDLAAAFRAKHADVTVWTFDTYALFDRVLDDPEAFVETKGYANTTGFCEGYAGGTAELDTFIEECEIPVNEYFWLDSLHPTYPVHDLLAAQIAKELEG